MSEQDAFKDGREQGWRDKGRECEWRPIETAPMDGAFRFYGLHVRNHRTGHQWFEAHYVALDDGELLHPSGDIFGDWTYDHFEVWAPAPSIPADRGPFKEP